MNDTVPNTLNYMLLGYAVFFGSLGFYILSWFVRRRNLERDLEMLNSLQTEPEPPTEAAPTPPVLVTR